MKVLAFGDTHFPFENKKTLKKLYKYIEREKPDVVVHVGDLYDNYMFSRFDKDYNVIKPKEEIARANKKAVEMWGCITKLSPKSKCYQLLGNHDSRIPKSILRCLPVLTAEFKLLSDKYYTFLGVETLKSERDFIELDGVIYCHGWHNSCAAHMRHFKKPVVHGHNHVPDLVTEPMRKSNYIPMWEMDLGCLCDAALAPFEYTNTRLTLWQPALGIITNGKPELFIL